MTSPILVTGGTGTLGRLVVPLLRAAGRPVRVLSRHDQRPPTASSSWSASCTPAPGSTPR